MVAQSIASRSRRREAADPDDIVLARLLHLTEWARRNVILVVVAGVALVVGLGGLFWYRTDRARRVDNAAIAFLQVEQGVLSGDPSVAMRELQLFIQQHGGTTYADEARVLLAQVHLRGDQPAEAIDVLRPVADRLNRSPVGVQAALLMATAQEAAGETDAAIQTFQRVANDAEMEFRQQEALMGAALLRQEEGDYAGAAELFRRLVDRAEPGSMDRSLYEMRLAEAEALATLQ